MMNASNFSDIMLPIVLIVIMFGMGLSLTLKDFKRIIFHPKPIATGLVAQMVALPVIAFLLIGFTGLDPVIKVGFILIAACPGGTAANLIVYLLNGRIALSVSLTGINSLLILITLPLIVNLALLVFLGRTTEITLPVMDTISKILYTVIIPVFTGVYIRRKYPQLSDKIQKPLKYIMVSLLFLVFAIIIIFEEQKAGGGISSYMNVIPWAFALNVTAIFASYYFSNGLKLKKPDNYTISIEVGMQNSALAIYVASSLLENHQMAVVAVIYSSFTFFSTAFFGYLLKKYF